MMIIDSQVYNATPQRLNFVPPQIPRMPFSSPMGEEVLSPTSPPQSSRTPPQDQRLGSPRAKERGKAPLSSGGFLTESSIMGGVPGQMHERQDKSRLPGLNVVTSFSKAPRLIQRPADGTGKQSQGLRIGRQTVQNTTNEAGNLGLAHQPSGSSLKLSASKGRLDDLKRAASKASTLSPSDRAVMIGISVSPEDLPDQDISADASPAEPEGLGNGRYDISRRPSVTPSIVLTPARRKAHGPNRSDEPLQMPQRRARAASSVYSQVQQNGVRSVQSSMVPPIPPLPPDVPGYRARFDQSHVQQPPQSSARIVSASTIFDEERNSEVGERPSTGDSQLRILTKQASMDSITSTATRHRSRGWWDHIVTPFWPRSPMTFKGPSPPMPILPKPRQAVETRPDQERPTSSHISPLTAEHEGLRSGHTSWTDLSLDAECEKSAFDLDEQPHPELIIFQPPQELPVMDTPVSPISPMRHEGFGAAAEYYEASLYDMHSREPYFKCQNHTCLPLQVGLPEAIVDQRNVSAREMDDGVGIRVEQERLDAEPLQSLVVQQAPRNRFSAAFREVVTPKPGPKSRVVSEETEIEDLNTTPDIAEAHAAPIVRAPEPIPATQPILQDDGHHNTREIETSRAVTPSESTPHNPPAYSPPREVRPPKRYVAVMPPNHQPNTFNRLHSPATQIPSSRRRVPQETLPMAEVPRVNSEPHVVDARNTPVPCYRDSETIRPETTLADLYPPPRDPGRSQKSWEVRKTDAQKSRGYGSKVLAGFDKCFSRRKKPVSKKKKWMLIALAIGLLLMVIAIMILAMTLTRKGGRGQTVPVETTWLNMTGYPPIPTGISTIVKPELVSGISGCITPSTMWTCELPKEEQQSYSTGAADQPNFRVEIVFQNGTNDVTANTSSVNRRSDGSSHRKSYGRMVSPVAAGRSIRHRFLQGRNAISETMNSPSPSPPSQEDQTFLGNTTDNDTAPFDGEYTPFFMSFLSPTKLPSRLLKRQSSSSSDNTTDPFPNMTNSIPPADINPNGTAAAAVLLPYPSSQPLRLYNRGQSTEHYGFYTYFSKSIFLKSTAPIDGISNDTNIVPDDEDGGADEDAAFVRCTWAQTRFLVQIWTNKGFVASSRASDNKSTIFSGNSTNLTTSSANDFQAPGSFPYPVTVTLDRHGGDIYSKMVYCYALDDEEKPISSQKKIELEDRSFGGTLVNPTQGPFENVNVTLADGGPGGIDGGSGGCGCQWKNFDWQ